jgi:3-dehydroquinate synthetase
LWSEAEQQRLVGLLQMARLPVKFPTLSASQTRRFWSALAGDKKNVGGTLRFILPEKFGKVRVISGVKPADVRAALK